MVGLWEVPALAVPPPRRQLWFWEHVVLHTHLQ